MRLCTFEVGTQLGSFRRLGVVSPNGVADLNFAAAHHLGNQKHADALVPPSLLGLLEGGALSRKIAQDAIAYLPPELHRGARSETLHYQWDEIRLLTPLPDARSLRDFFAFEAHVKRGFEKRNEPM